MTPLFSFSLLLVLLWFAGVQSYEAPKEKEDVFAKKACPAFLTFTNAAHLAGVTVELPCHCKPQQIQSVVWFFKKHLGGSEETKVLTDRHGNKLLDPNRVPHSGDLQSRFSIRLFSLLIFRAGTGDSGVYICGSAKRDFFYAYDLDIQEARKFSFTPRLTPEDTTKSSTVRKVPSSAKSLYRIFTGFRPWSVCDRCGVPGEQVRAGLCFVESKFLHVRFRRANQNVTSCGSGAVPKAFESVRKSRIGAKLEVKGCEVTCPEEGPSSSKIQTLMSFLGFDSGSKSARVPVFYLSHPAGRLLIMGCPGARPNMAVAWDQGSTPIYRSPPSGRHNGGSRLEIDTGHHLVFKPAKTQDSGVYFCWLQGRTAAEIRLLVYAHLGRRQSVTSHPDFPLAVWFVLRSYAAMTGVFLLILVCRALLKEYRDETTNSGDTSETNTD
ncbi:Ig-like V-type domain-containing protein FAM187A isoform X2 [Xyrichtys novacula]|uniref:Ig-like V-type domain-containing protein FAM187A isoform X2 n=1 Tax=Xyrichtys novacula TaxID=13765 RepID=A0AAV1HEL2_XYRNO|nr:Ig-like V-type domain-containing protein FAM187A isoform X2 [Xyrichtys novacula]